MMADGKFFSEEVMGDKTEQPIEIHWVEPDIQREQGEIKRVAREKDLPEGEIMEAISRGGLEDLTEEMWSALENTESHDHVRLGHMEDVQQFAERGSHGRDWKTLLKAMKEGSPMLSPIVLIKPDGVPHLVSGNTRLMLSRVLGAKVQVFVARMKEK